MIEVVPAESGDAVAGDHRMRVRVEFHQGSVEGAAAQVVDQQAANQLDAVAELDRGGGRLVERVAPATAPAASARSSRSEGP
jgi:hypothetical protein